MDEIILERKERIKMFLNEYYFGVPKLITAMRLIAGPLIGFLGLNMLLTASDRFGIGYGGVMIAICIYYTLLPLWWILRKWKSYETIEFNFEADPDQIIINESESETKIEYAKFKNIIQRKNYFVLMLEHGSKIYLPLEKLSQKTIETLSEKGTVGDKPYIS